MGDAKVGRDVNVSNGVLSVVSGGRTLLLRPDQTASIGRSPECDLMIDDPLISRHHLMIRCGTNGWVVEDHGSRNGLFVNGERVGQVIVGVGGQEVRVGAADGAAVQFTLPDGGASPQRPGPSSGALSQAAQTIRIGRADDNDVVVDDLLVSRYHAELRRAGSIAELVDLGSHNGTFLGGRRISRDRVSEGDFVGIGAQSFRVTAQGLEPWVEGGATFVASDLVVRTPEQQVLLDHLSLALEANSFLAVVGPSGAGKSTLLNALTGIRPADQGILWYEGRDLYKEYDDLRRHIGIVPQDDVLHRQLTVRQALVYSAELRFPPEVSKAERLRRVEEVMAELGLTDRADLAIHRLSGGQRKRTSVAIELLTKPSLLFLDEPTSGLDPGYERSLMQLLRTLADGGRTVVVVTHAVNSLHLCDRVLVMAPGGAPAYFGPPQQAPAFFGEQDFQGVFQRLTADDGVDWPAHFAASPERDRFVTSRLPVVGIPQPRSTPPVPHGGLRQFGTLTRRFLRVVVSDRSNLRLLALQAPVLGLLMLVISPPHQLARPQQGQLRLFSGAAILLFDLVEAATWVGMSNAIRELVKERSIFRRERSVGLSIPAYLLSKVAVLSIIAGVQMGLLVLVATLRESGPAQGLVLGWGVGELIVVLATTAVAAMALGLLISALVSTENVAVTLLPVVLIVSNVLALGGVYPTVLEKPILKQAQFAAGTQWGFAAAASTADLNRLQGLTRAVEKLGTVDMSNPQHMPQPGDLKIQGERRFRHKTSVWLADMGALVAMTLACLIGAGLALGRLDPALVR